MGRAERLGALAMLRALLRPPRHLALVDHDIGVLCSVSEENLDELSSRSGGYLVASKEGASLRIKARRPGEILVGSDDRRTRLAPGVHLLRLGHYLRGVDVVLGVDGDRIVVSVKGAYWRELRGRKALDLDVGGERLRAVLEPMGDHWSLLVELRGSWRRDYGVWKRLDGSEGVALPSGGLARLVVAEAAGRGPRLFGVKVARCSGAALAFLASLSSLACLACLACLAKLLACLAGLVPLADPLAAAPHLTTRGRAS